MRGSPSAGIGIHRSMRRLDPIKLLKLPDCQLSIERSQVLRKTLDPCAIHFQDCKHPPRTRKKDGNSETQDRVSVYFPCLHIALIMHLVRMEVQISLESVSSLYLVHES